MGAHDQEDRSTDEVGRFLSSVRFEHRGKLDQFDFQLGNLDKKNSEKRFDAKGLKFYNPGGPVQFHGLTVVEDFCDILNPDDAWLSHLAGD